MLGRGPCLAVARNLGIIIAKPSPAQQDNNPKHSSPSHASLKWVNVHHYAEFHGHRKTSAHDAMRHCVTARPFGRFGTIEQQARQVSRLVCPTAPRYCSEIVAAGIDDYQLRVQRPLSEPSIQTR